MKGKRMTAQEEGRQGFIRGSCRALGVVLGCLLPIAAPGCLQEYPPYDIVISHYDPAQVCAGDTFFQSHLMSAALFAVSMEGDLLWEYRHETFGLGFNLLGDGNILAQPGGHPEIIDPKTNTRSWTAPEVQTHHTIMETPWGTFLSLRNQWQTINYGPSGNCRYLADFILEFNRDGQAVWEWHLADYVDPAQHHPEGFCSGSAASFDWSHCNTVKLIADYAYGGSTYPVVVVLLSRELDTFYLIDYETGDILWSCGQHGDFGRREPPAEPLINKAHEIEMLPGGNFIIYDNGSDRTPQVSRAVELAVDPVAGTAEWVWSWTDPEVVMFAPWGGDADRLPNGNTLISDVLAATIIEVNPQGDKVWQMQVSTPEHWLAYSIYQMKRLRPAFFSESCHGR